MKKTGLDTKSIHELRALAKKKGIDARNTWKKEDFVKALSDKTPPGKTTAKKAAGTVKSKTPAKKTAPSPVIKDKKSASPAKTPEKTRKASAPVKAVIKKAKTKTEKKPIKKTALKSKGKSSVKKAKTAPAKKTAPKTGAKPSGKAVSIMLPAIKPVKRTGKVTGPSVVSGKRPGKLHIDREAEPTPGYPDNKIVSMPVTPKRIYVYWEITEPSVSRQKGSLNLKVISTSPGNVSFFLPVSERIGEHFINADPGNDYIIEIGVINLKGRFVKLSQSQPVATPVASVQAREVPYTHGPEEAQRLPDEFFEVPESVSQY